MRCPACNHKSDTPETCPECGRAYADSLERVAAREGFMGRLLICHVIWVVTGLGIPIYLIPQMGHIGLFFLFMYMVPAVVVTILGAAIEWATVLPALRKIEASDLQRHIWCAVIGLPGPVCSVFAWLIVHRFS